LFLDEVRILFNHSAKHLQSAPNPDVAEVLLQPTLTDYGYTGDLDHAVGIVKARYLNQSDGWKVLSEYCPVSGANRLLVIPIVFQSCYVDGQFNIVCDPSANRFDRGF